MKTTAAARQIARVRLFLSMLGIVAILGTELGLGGAMAARMGQSSSRRTRTQVESVDMGLGDLVAFPR